jgi:hypothetical protein
MNSSLICKLILFHHIVNVYYYFLEMSIEEKENYEKVKTEGIKSLVDQEETKITEKKKILEEKKVQKK